MRCERARDLFSDFCEGSLRGGLLVTLEGHLKGCNQCTTEVDELRKVWSILDDAPSVEPPSNFRAVVWQKIDELENSRLKSRRRVFDWRTMLARPAFGLAAPA